jgi:hypothetical protein
MDQEEDIYIIPHNYQENGKILGIIEPQSFYIGLTWLILWGIVFYILEIESLATKFMGYLVVAVLPAILVFIGIGHDSVVDYVKYYLNFTKNAKVYYYEK